MQPRGLCQPSRIETKAPGDSLSLQGVAPPRVPFRGLVRSPLCARSRGPRVPLSRATWVLPSLPTALKLASGLLWWVSRVLLPQAGEDTLLKKHRF